MLTLIAPPAELAVPEAAAWDHLNLIVDDDEPADAALVRSLIEGAISEVDGAEGMLRRALITQRWALFLDSFPRRAIEVPLPPLQAVTCIKYRRPVDGVWVTLPTGEYEVIGIGGDGRVMTAPGKAWPTTLSAPASIEVRFRAGYGDSAGDVPAAIRQALLETVATRYGHRESITPAGKYFELPRSAQDALANFMVWR